ncbi:MAG: CdaR family protein [Ruminococcus sp.]|nr:CdaR family protein [Ruminococcus sp.]
MKNKRLSLNMFTHSDHFIFIIAVVISVSIWIYMSMGSTNDTNVTVTNIPVQIELSEDAKNNGLQVFSGGDQRASVTISGNRAILGAISSSDITLTATANIIESAGEYELSVNATKSNPASSFNIISNPTPNKVKVIVDYLRESTFQIQENIIYKVADGYYASPSLAVNSVAISGPQTEISKIAKVSAVADVNETLKSPTNVNCELILYDNNGEIIDPAHLNMDITSIQAAISVLPEKTVTVVPVFANNPSGFTVDKSMITIEPDTIKLAGPSDILNKTTTVNLESLDFRTLKNSKATFDLGIDIPVDCKNISNTTTAKVTIDFSGLESKTFTVDKINVKGLSSDYKASVTQNNISVTVIGTEDELEKLSEGSIVGVIDVSENKGTIGSVQMPVSFSINNKNCWIYGSYKANITISKS